MAVPTEQELLDLIDDWEDQADAHVEWLEELEDTLPVSCMEDISAYWNARSNTITDCKEDLQAYAGSYQSYL